MESALVLARERVVVATLNAVDAFDAAEQIARAACPAIGAAAPIIGILGVRLMESLCGSCRRSIDLHEALSPAILGVAGSGPFFFGPGCSSCRGSGFLNLETVCEFLPAEPGDSPFRAGREARALRQWHTNRGMRTLFQASLQKASDGVLDVREPLRFLLHEQH